MKLLSVPQTHQYTTFFLLLFLLLFSFLVLHKPSQSVRDHLGMGFNSIYTHQCDSVKTSVCSTMWKCIFLILVDQPNVHHTVRYIYVIVTSPLRVPDLQTRLTRARSAGVVVSVNEYCTIRGVITDL